MLLYHFLQLLAFPIYVYFNLKEGTDVLPVRPCDFGFDLYPDILALDFDNELVLLSELGGNEFI